MTRPPAKSSSSNGRLPLRTARRLEATSRELAQVFKLLGDETRLRILYLLAMKEEVNVGMICTELGQSQPAISHHLALLRVAGLIQARRQGKLNLYSLRPESFRELVVTALSAVGPLPSRFRVLDMKLTFDAR
jgi:ArsR family transcriptional regulator